MHPYKNIRMLEEVNRDRAIEIFLIKYPFLLLDGFPKCTLGHLRSVLTELEIIRLDEWRYFLNLVWEHMLSMANSLSFSDDMEEEIREKMHSSLHSVLLLHYRDKLNKKIYSQLLTEIYGHSFSNYKWLSGTPYC